MATVTGLTADRMLEIEAASIIDGEIIGDDLILTRHNATTINAGIVRGAQGDPGPAGSDLVVLTTKIVRDVGLVDQIRAGRQLTATDFTVMGLTAPIGLYNLSSVADSSGNGRSLVNKGTVLFSTGINGLVTTAALFAGSTAQGLYITDTGAADPFRCKTVSLGCWFRSAKRGTGQALISKYLTDGTVSYWLQVQGSTNCVQFAVSPNGTIASGKTVTSLSDVCDDRWHFIVATFDGSVIRIYVDGVHESNAFLPGPIFASAAPFNIGALAAGAATPAINPNFGLIDEAFITSDVLSGDQIRNLYCAKIPHILGAVPKRAAINVHRLRKGVALSPGDFPTAPLRLYNFSAGALTNDGPAAALTNTGASVTVSGVDGSPNNAFYFNGLVQSLFGTDAGLPSGLNPWSFGHWIKTTNIVNQAPGYYGGSPYSVLHWVEAGNIKSRNVNAGDDILGPFVADGEWHFIVTTAHNTPVDGVKRKLYVDGRLVGGSTVLTTFALGGATAYRVGAGNLGTDLPFIGSVDGAFVCDYALTSDQIMSLYIKGTQGLGISPKNPGDHVELMNSTDLLCIFDTLEMQHQIDLAVA